MAEIHINHLAVVVAALAQVALGALWYSPLLFYRAWMRTAGVSEEQLASGSGRFYVIAVVTALVIAYNLAFFLGDSGTTAAWGLSAGALAGFGWATASVVVIAAAERRPTAYAFIHAGYIVIAFAAAGLIIGAWR